jgi:hypothetical protein
LKGLKVQGHAAIALLALLAAGCADTDRNGQPDTVTPEVRRAAGKALDTAVKQAGKAATNARVAGGIRTALSKDPTVSLYRLDVDVDNGVATLKGEVHTAKERARAEEIARKQSGVTEVRNRIKSRDGR